MDDTTKLLVALGAGLGLYYLLSPMLRKAEAHEVPATIREIAVMQYGDIIWSVGVKYALEPALIAALIEVESGGNASATGAIDEIGLMQIRPLTALWECQTSASDLLNPTKNVDCGTKYLKKLLGDRNGDVAAAVASYNAGASRVSYDARQYLKMPATTKEYVSKILGAVGGYRVLFQIRYGAAYNTAFPPAAWNMSTAHLASLGRLPAARPGGRAIWVN